MLLLNISKWYSPNVWPIVYKLQGFFTKKWLTKMNLVSEINPVVTEGDSEMWQLLMI